VARDNRWVTEDTARSIFASMAGQLGVEVDATQEAEELKKEQIRQPTFESLRQRYYG